MSNGSPIFVHTNLLKDNNMAVSETAFSNIRNMMHVEKTSGNLSLVGDAEVNDQGWVTTFNGNVNSTDGSFSNFSYQEMNADQVSRSYNGSKSIEPLAWDLVESVVTDIKVKFPAVN